MSQIDVGKYIGDSSEILRDRKRRTARIVSCP